MPRKSSGEKLERKDLILYAGDWDRLGELLAPTRVTRTEFIRRLVRKTILRIEAARAGIERPVEDIDARSLDATIESASHGRSE